MLRWTALTWAWFSIRTFPQRSHSIRRNHDGKARRDAWRASSGVGDSAGSARVRRIVLRSG